MAKQEAHNQCMVYAIDDRKPIATWNVPADEICATISPDGDLVVTGHEKGVRFWSVTHPVESDSISIDSVLGVDFSPDGKYLAVSTFGATIEIVDVQTRSRTQLTGHLRHVGAVRFSPDGKRLASAGSGANDALKLWDVKSRRELLTLQVTIGDGYSNRQIEWSPNGNSILMMGGDARVSIWRVPSFGEIERLEKQRELVVDTNTRSPE